jgi:hypothetical protein
MRATTLQGQIHIDGFALGHDGSLFGRVAGDAPSGGWPSPTPFSPGDAALQ